MSIEDEFESFMRQAFPGVSEMSAQYRESRNIWFASAHSYSVAVLELSYLPMDDAEKELARLLDEIRAFHARHAIEHKEALGGK